jgi:hypothetical protein
VPEKWIWTLVVKHLLAGNPTLAYVTGFLPLPYPVLAASGPAIYLLTPRLD